MRKLFFFFLIVLLFIPLVYSACGEGQIDINSASAEELDKLYGIGAVKADSIISTRPFNSVDELINVSGIGEITLAKIKEQGLACVENEAETTSENEEETSEEENTTELENIVVVNESINNQNLLGGGGGAEEENKKNTPEIIYLTPITPKDIKTKSDSEVSDNSKYVKYGFVLFCVLLGLLFILRRRRKIKNEFEEKRKRHKRN